MKETKTHEYWTCDACGIQASEDFAISQNLPKGWFDTKTRYSLNGQVCSKNCLKVYLKNELDKLKITWEAFFYEMYDKETKY